VLVVHLGREHIDLRRRRSSASAAASAASAHPDLDAVHRLPVGCVDDQRAWGAPLINTFDFGYFGANIVSLKLDVPLGAAGNKTRTTSWTEYGSGPVVREAVFSTRPCDFGTQYAVKNGLGAAMRAQDVIRFSFTYTVGVPSTFAANLTPGQTYYLNIRNRYSDGTLSCAIDACTMRGSFPP
jgi:hypothetical protein